jgi:transposase
MLLASSRDEVVPQIAKNLGCGAQTVRDAIHDFNERALDALIAGSSRPKRTHAAFDEQRAEALREMLHHSPREFLANTAASGRLRWPLSEFRARLERKAGLRGDDSGYSGAPSWSALAASQAMDHKPGSSIRKKKGGATG